MEPLYLGLDIGSVSVNTVLLNGNGEVVWGDYTRHQGQPLATAYRILQDLPGSPQGLGTTGGGGKLASRLLGGIFVNEVVAQAKAMGKFHPEIHTVIEMGGEDSKIILLQWDPRIEETIVEDFAMNTLCAAGTGSFLDQQAKRLGLSIEKEFSQLALKSKNPPRIAGRCSVFAKSDMIHLQQIGTADYDIVAGLCLAVARNFKSSIARGKKFIKPISFQGGVAANQGMVRAFEKVLGLQEGKLVIPEHFASLGAIGAGLMAMEKGEAGFVGLDKLRDHLNEKPTLGKGLEKLQYNPQGKRYEETVSFPPQGGTEAYLGIDVGSLSTNLVVLDRQKKVLARRYLPTAGRPIEAVKRGLQEIGGEVGEKVEIVGVGTTGSGRYLTGDFVGADVVRNEITSQARAAVEIDPQVDTIFEIGGQDSKYISLRDGAVVDFEMNKVCAAGTGSFLEEQAQKLNFNIVNEFGEKALRAPSPANLGERCTVFIESDLVAQQAAGAKKEDLVAGLAYSIVYNYLNRVVAGKRVGERIFFQGGVAWNKGVVAAFEQVTGKPITVPPHHDVTGAIGAAILAMEEKGEGKSRFKGFDLSQRKYKLSSFECRSCPNRCEIKVVKFEGEAPLFYGGRCEKYEVRREDKGKDLPDLFDLRWEALLEPYNKAKKGEGPTVGLPLALHFHELLPFWTVFFVKLGYEVVLSEPTNKEIINQGLEAVTGETCFPVKVAHGHVIDLLKKGVDYIFLPSIIDMPSKQGLKQSYNCPYVQAIPYLVRSAIDFTPYSSKLLYPPFHLHWERKYQERELIKFGKELGKSAGKIKEAMKEAEAAQERFYSKLLSLGQKALEELPSDRKAIVLVSRPYNGCDPGVNLDLAKKLRKLGVLPIPMDLLPIEEVNLSNKYSDMYWRYGQKIMSAAELISRDKRLFALYLTNFSCGADSFITHFFREKMQGKPYLLIEIDEHSADAGVITRCEAFLDSLKSYREEPEGAKPLPEVIFTNGKLRTLYIPYMSDQAFALKAALRATGVRAEVMPPTDEESLKWGRKYTSGKECFPFILTTGDLVKMIKSPGFEPEKTAFFMPKAEGPCRFGQYNHLHRIILDEQGYEDIPLVSPDSETSYNDFGNVDSGFRHRAWQGMLAVDLLQKVLHHLRPYELEKGTTESVYSQCLQDVCQTVEAKGNLGWTVGSCLGRFSAIRRAKDGDKPLIGVVGEIFIRSNLFSNNNVIKRVESLGGETQLASFCEWIFYTNFMYKYRSKARGRHLEYAKGYLQDMVQRWDEARIYKSAHRLLRDGEEPSTEELIKLASPYFHHTFGGEAILTVGKAIDLVKKGASGIVNTMPFTCMPGTIVSAVAKKLREDLDGLPWLDMAYDGLEEATAQTRLEAFIHQARGFSKSRRGE